MTPQKQIIAEIKAITEERCQSKEKALEFMKIFFTCKTCGKHISDGKMIDHTCEDKK